MLLVKPGERLTMNSKNILITGGAGFIGSNLALKLITKGYNVTVLDCLSKQIHGEDPEQNSVLYQSIKGKVNFIKGSVSLKYDLRKAFKGQAIIVHFAAETGTGQSMYDIDRYTEVNVGGTAKILDVLTNEKHSVKKIIVASSRALYGEGRYYCKDFGYVYPPQRRSEHMLQGDFEVKIKDYNLPLQLVATDENSKIQPTSIYGITKQFQEQLIMTICPTIGIMPVAFRYQNVYGPGQSLSNPYTGILSIFSTRIKNGKSLNIFEDGKESRDFLYIDDAVDATILGIEEDNANGEVFNVGGGTPIDVLTVACTLIEKFGKNVEVNVSGNYRIGDIRHNFADITKIRNLLGFSPKWKFADGISKFVEWAKIQKTEKDRYEASIEEMKSKGLFK
jgi:dTDP-L-rhamnose 4-epimerase